MVQTESGSGSPHNDGRLVVGRFGTRADPSSRPNKSDSANKRMILWNGNPKRQTMPEADKAEAIRQREIARIKSVEAEEQRLRAEANLRKAREAVDRLFTRVAADLADEPHMEQIRRELLEDALKFYQGFIQQKSDDPIIRLETAYAYDRVANIHALLGDANKALKNRRQHHLLLQQLHHDYRADPKYRVLLAQSFLSLSRVLRQTGAQDEAIENGRFALAEWEALARDFPTSSNYRLEIIQWYVSGNPSYYRGAVGDVEHETYLRRALTLLEQWQSDFPNEPPLPSLRFLATKRLADRMTSVGRFREAEEYYRAASAVIGSETPAFSTGFGTPDRPRPWAGGT